MVLLLLLILIQKQTTLIFSLFELNINRRKLASLVTDGTCSTSSLPQIISTLTGFNPQSLWFLLCLGCACCRADLMYNIIMGRVIFHRFSFFSSIVHSYEACDSTYRPYRRCSGTDTQNHSLAQPLLRCHFITHERTLTDAFRSEHAASVFCSTPWDSYSAGSEQTRSQQKGVKSIIKKR